jgi:hypothetical protein
MKTIHYKETLFWYDCVQVFSAMDAIGGNYLSVLIAGNEAEDNYLAVGVSPESLRYFKSGKLELRDLILGREYPDWYTVKLEGDFSVDLKLESQTGEIPEELIPAEGFYLSAVPLDSEFVLKESKARNNVIFEAWIDPPEAARESKIHANTLAGFLTNIQTLVKHSYNKALAKMSLQGRKGLDEIDAHTIDAFGFAPGSFKVIFESYKGPDLFGFVELQRALEKLDEITDHADSPADALEVMKENQGHLVGAYIRLLDFLIKTDTAFAYKWSGPSSDKATGRTITAKQAIPLFETFTKAAQLGIENVELHGFLRKANSKNNTWTIESVDDGREYSGECKPGVTVSHLTIDGIYRFKCEERLEEQAATGKETRKLSLVSFVQG